MSKTILKKIIIGISILCIALLLIYFVTNKDEKQKIELKNDKETIYDLFVNFPESKNIYYTYHNLYNERSIGPSIYQIDILAELTEESYINFINKVEKSKNENLKMKFNPNNIKYSWKKIENITILESKDGEKASVKKIYFDENNRSIYIVAIGGN